jgi:hypothetical protein
MMGGSEHVTIETIIRTISLILAPVVMITCCGIFLNGLITRYNSMSDRIRAMHHERLELLQALANKISRAEYTSGFSTHRVQEIEIQLPKLLCRYKLIRNAVLLLAKILQKRSIVPPKGRTVRLNRGTFRPSWLILSVTLFIVKEQHIRLGHFPRSLKKAFIPTSGCLREGDGVTELTGTVGNVLCRRAW